VSPPRRRRTRARPNPSPTRRAPARDFWGQVDDERAEAVDDIRRVDDPAVLVRSLGPPPLPGHEIAAQHYFDAVYDKAASLAVALAAASGLLAMEQSADDDEPMR
jgi:hypothetical protein